MCKVYCLKVIKDRSATGSVNGAENEHRKKDGEETMLEKWKSAGSEESYSKPNLQQEGLGHLTLLNQ